jgi:hypothetical protein
MTQPARGSRLARFVALLLGIVGAGLVLVALVYFTNPISELPEFFPGATTFPTTSGPLVGSDPVNPEAHKTIYGVIALFFGLMLIVAAWITTTADRRQ